MKLKSLALASFRHYWKSHLGLMFGSFLAAAVLSGSLFVGDSVRTSLRRAAELRLGRIQSGLIAGDRWFTQRLALQAKAAPLIILRGSVTGPDGSARVNSAQILGVDAGFWKLSPEGSDVTLGADELAVNESLARRLGVKIGDSLLVRLEKPGAISRDAPLSGEASQDITFRRKIAAVIPAETFGEFSLLASPQGVDNIFVPLNELAGMLGRAQRANALITEGSPDQLGSGLDLHRRVEDFSLVVRREQGAAEGWEVTTDRVFLEQNLADKIFRTTPKGRGVLAYLLNGLSSAGGRTPYSFAAAVEPAEFPEFTAALQVPHAAVITQWLADDLHLVMGDRFDIRYFTVGNGRELVEQTAVLTVAGILPMSDPRVNPGWTPDFPGVSDAKNCRDWQPGIPMKLDAIRDKDEAYWKEFKSTPKIFISLREGQQLWENRFGNLTGIRFSEAGQDVNKLCEQLVKNLRLADIGLTIRDFRSEALKSAKGSVDFGGLFLGMSMFLIFGSLIFSALLYLFTLETRLSQFGVLYALGFDRINVTTFVLFESGLVLLLGSALGIFGGLIYAKLAISGLNSVWSGATAGFRLIYNFNPATLMLSLFFSLMTGMGTLWLASRRIFQSQPYSLLAGEIWGRGTSGQQAVVSGRAGIWTVATILLMAGAATLPFAGLRASNPEVIAGMFFGSGFCLLAAGLLLIRSRLLRASVSTSAGHLPASLKVIGLRNIIRRPGRSLAVIGMMAGGIFLVIAVNAFRLGAVADTARRDSGTGGFALIGESTLPVYEDLNRESAWDAFALDEKLMRSVKMVPLRVRPGDDASCLNLNKAQNPVLCAVNAASLAERKAFTFAQGSWDSIQASATSYSHSAIPAIADQATAQWGLGKGVGDTISYTDSQGREFQVRLAALLAGSVLQGKVIISERDFLAKYPDAAGYQFFLVDAPPEKTSDVRRHLTRQLEARGLALEPSADRLAAFNAVQNTYIGIFTVLGGLGVLLGTAGLGVLAMRNVLERRGEFGLMQALGFRRRPLQNMVLVEHAALLAGGLLLGLVSAAIAVLPSVRHSGGAMATGFLISLNVGILVFGISSCWIASKLALRGRLLDAVRKE